jgi:uncharacterized membrane protein YkvA (DUF1232 family)
LSGFFRLDKQNMEKKTLLKFIRKNWKLILVIVYLLSPLDIIPDVIPVFGATDDIALALLAVLSKYIEFRKEHKSKVQEGELVE